MDHNVPTTGLDNDARGWIMCLVSGIACVGGASIICVDVLVRMIPSKKDFSIQDSNVFLAASLSLSFGVMLFSALYSMLPSSREYLKDSGFSGSAAAWIQLACFAAGFMGIQIVSRVLHHFIPHHVVDCDHEHKAVTHDHSRDQSRRPSRAARGRRQSSHPPPERNGRASESTPLLHPGVGSAAPQQTASVSGDGARSRASSKSRRPSMIEVQQRVKSFIQDIPSDHCADEGPCFGYSEPCAQECFKEVALKTPSRSRHNTLIRSATVPGRSSVAVPARLEEEDDESNHASTQAIISPRATTFEHEDVESHGSDDEDLEAQHHHHVPENEFLSIGLQTSIAIALHKLPEGFITYATNHANPTLGFSVFMALFIHNISEGFALALPLYLALHSRLKAMVLASLLGGVSQPFGAGIAALWFKIAGSEGHKPGSTVYGAMFAITAGIMASVALSLFVESLSLNHNRNLCIAFGFLGMAIMGLSNALTA